MALRITFTLDECGPPGPKPTWRPAAAAGSPADHPTQPESNPMKQHDDDDDQTIDLEPDDELEVEFEPDFIPDEPSGDSLVAPIDLAAAIAAWDHGDAATSTEEAARIQALKTLRRHPERLFKLQLVADAPLLERLAVLRGASPNFSEVTDLVDRAARLAIETNTRLKVPPLLLLGGPGIGKSHYARRLAEALGSSVQIVAGTSLTDRGTIAGLTPLWRGARPGCVAKALLVGKTLSPVIVFDEVDKATTGYNDERMLDVLLPLLEPETARSFVDEYWGVPMRADGVLWVLTANDIRALSAPLLDRLVIIRVPPLDPAQCDAVTRAIFAEINRCHLDAFEPLDGEVLRALASSTSRRIRTIIDMALGHAVVAGRHRLTTEDVRAARALVSADHHGRGPMGFRLSASTAVEDRA